MRDNLGLDVVEGNLDLKYGEATIDIEDLHDKRHKLVINLKAEFRVAVSRG